MNAHDDNDRSAAGPPAPGDGTGTRRPMSVREWALAGAPHLSEVSNSDPTAEFRRHNLVAITDELDVARAVALDFERSSEADADTTTVVLGHAVSREAKGEADPEGVTSHAARRTLLGGVPGAVACALIIALGVWLITGSAAATAGAALGGAVFGFYVTAVWSFVIGTGQSQAYQQGFVDPDAADAIIVVLHVDDPATVEQARTAVAAEDRIRLFDLDEGGQLLR
jgi:hypothetical protein